MSQDFMAAILSNCTKIGMLYLKLALHVAKDLYNYITSKSITNKLYQQNTLHLYTKVQPNSQIVLNIYFYVALQKISHEAQIARQAIQSRDAKPYKASLGIFCAIMCSKACASCSRGLVLANQRSGLVQFQLIVRQFNLLI